MMRIHASGRSDPYCDGLSRRSFVQLGVAGMASVGLAEVMRAQAAGKAKGIPDDRAAIMLWLDGGPGHMDLYDMKPEAPAEYRGLWTPIKTNVSGIEMTEYFPRQAQIADKLCIVRSLYHDDGDHFGAAHRMLTTKGGVSGGSQATRFPGIGAIVAHQAGHRHADMPPYIAVQYAMSVGRRPGYFAGHLLGASYDPFETGGDPNAANFNVQNVALTNGMTIARLDDRVNLHQRLDRISREIDRRRAFETMDQFERSAVELVTGPRGREAFDIGKEDEKLREEYGRNSFGQSCLLARRLVEHGARFVTVHSGGWDHHWDLQAGMERLLPQIDAGTAGLVSDLHRRGMLEKTLVILCGEFSRTPRMNDGSGNGTPGRDHWGNSMFTLLAGGGIRGGQIYGSTDSKGERPKDCPVKPDRLHATIYKSLGMNPDIHLLDHQGRPTPVLENAEPINELF
jgi:uncharacterized protein (DUF1501 family)